MESPFSLIVKRIAGKSKQSFSSPMEVCLGEWWLTKLEEGKGIAVSGHPIETRRCDKRWKEFHSAPVKKRYATREFHSKQIVKRHGCTTLESADGYILSLCGFLNRSRTQQNGFSSEVCRDFIYGFPINWEASAAQFVDILVTPKASNKRRLDTLAFSYTEQEVGVASVSSCSDGFLYDVHVEQEGGLILLSRPRENCLDLVEIDNDGTLYNVEVMENLQPKLQPCQKLGKDALTSRKRICKRETETMNFEIGETVITSEASTKEGAVAKPATVVLTSRNRVCISVKNLENSEIEKNVNVLPKASIDQGCSRDAGKNHLLIGESSSLEGKANLEGGKSVDQSDVKPLLQRLTSVGQNLKGKGSRLCNELKKFLY